MKMKLLVVFVCYIGGAVQGANILAFFFFPSVSHQRVLRPIAEKLSLIGHKVTLVTPNPENNSSLSNLTEIDVSVGYEVFQYDSTKFNRDSVEFMKIIIVYHQLYRNIIWRQLESEGVKDLLKESVGSFDLILVEGNTPAYFGLQHKFQAPLVAISSYNSAEYYQYLLGNSIHPKLYPDIFSEHSGPISNMLDKIDSVYVTLVSHLFNQFLILPNIDELVRPYFGNNMPYIGDLVRNASMMMLNVNPIISDRRSLAPNVVHFYGLHLMKNEILSYDLQKVLDESKNGVVYFSLGTNVRFQYLQKNIKETILEALGGLPYTVLCKWEDDDHPGRPKNVILRKWFPQQSILAHPNIKVFVTQGGLQSIEEAISNAKPMVVIPFLGDQPMNGRILASRGIAEVIMPKSIDKDILRDTILKIAQNERYLLKAQELRDIYLDQPESGMDKVIWWCEYVMRHKGATHLRSPGADIPLYEYFMLDILLLFFVVSFAAYKTLCLVISISMKLLKSTKSTNETKLKEQ